METPLFIAAQQGHTDTLQLLLDLGADKDTKNEEGASALYAALMSGHEAAARLLIRTGINLEERDVDGDTLLIAAALNGLAPAVSLLLEARADRHATDTDGCTALECAEQRGHTDVATLLRGGAVDSASRPSSSREFAGTGSVATGARFYQSGDGAKRMHDGVISECREDGRYPDRCVS
mmetsp:Transcript_73113/g.219543  ORF Transcript_73113/g.219543 Transcript_73113/m.219543 type:complete len:179 (-) Transcript_73113:60-596(-)